MATKGIQLDWMDGEGMSLASCGKSIRLEIRVKIVRGKPKYEWHAARQSGTADSRTVAKRRAEAAVRKDLRVAAKQFGFKLIEDQSFVVPDSW